MRFFKTFKEMHGEVLRDLAELSVQVITDTYQDKDIRGNPDFYTQECQNYDYTVTSPKLEDLEPIQPWADYEFVERLSLMYGIPFKNPGIAWKFRKEIWEEFLDKDGKFAYTYADRMAGPYEQHRVDLDTMWSNHNVGKIIDEIKRRPTSRQLYLPIWYPEDACQFGTNRIPCSLGYLFQVRQNALHMTYFQRSCDFVTHFINDVWMAYRLQLLVAEETSLPAGLFTHFIGSLHIFKKDTEGVF